MCMYSIDGPSTISFCLRIYSHPPTLAHTHTHSDFSICRNVDTGSYYFAPVLLMHVTKFKIYGTAQDMETTSYILFTLLLLLSKWREREKQKKTGLT